MKLLNFDKKSSGELSVTKNMFLNSYSSTKKNQKDSDDFLSQNLTLKVKFWPFLTPPHYTNSQNSMISFEYSWFLAKNISNFVSLPWNLHNRYCHNWKKHSRVTCLFCATNCPFLSLRKVENCDVFEKKSTWGTFLLTEICHFFCIPMSMNRLKKRLSLE